MHRGRSAHRLAGQLKIFLGGRARVPCALCALPARLGVSAHLGAPSLSGKRITAMYEARCHNVRVALYDIIVYDITVHDIIIYEIAMYEAVRVTLPPS